MRLILLIATLVISFNATSKGQFGAPITLKNLTPLETALANADGKTQVLVEANVKKVCEKKGCWMTLKAENNDLRVTFKNYGFFVPVTLEGKKVKVQGVVHKKTLSLKETKHYVEDAGGDPSTVTEPATEYRIVASGIKTIK